MQTFGLERDSGKRKTLLSFCGAGHLFFKPKLITSLEKGVEPYVKDIPVPGNPQQDDKGVSGSDTSTGESEQHC
jgi:hypothetical protein